MNQLVNFSFRIIMIYHATVYTRTDRIDVFAMPQSWELSPEIYHLCMNFISCGESLENSGYMIHIPMSESSENFRYYPCLFLLAKFMLSQFCLNDRLSFIVLPSSGLLNQKTDCGVGGGTHYIRLHSRQKLYGCFRL